jgi:outer membrane protein OmpA-like peptidoglycan-associated protein
LKSIHFCVNASEDTSSHYKLNSLTEKSRRIDIVFSINTKPHRNIHKGDKFILNGILFEGGNDLLLEESMPTLKTLYQELVKHPQLVIQIQGHIYDADFSWSEENQIETLSARRAKRIYEYLIFKGINPQRLSYIGLENQFPLHKGTKYDRRVEIEIVNI